MSNALLDPALLTRVLIIGVANGAVLALIPAADLGRLLPFVLALLAVLVYPLVDRMLGLGTLLVVVPILLFVILALGLNIVVGYAGLLDLGYAAFFAIGAYTTGFLTSPISPLAIAFPGVFPIDFWIALVASFVVGALFGIILGAPTLRLRGDYLAIVTLAFGEIVPRVFLNAELLTYGSRGIKPIGFPSFFGVSFIPINRQGTTILLVEQNALAALSIAHRGYVLQTGEIVLTDTSANLQQNELVRTAYLGED